MFSYYGSKKSIIDYYPPPKHDTIIEPFVGAGTYALKYWDRKIIVMDKYDVIIRIWKWLQECEISDIEKLPHFMGPDQSLNDFSFDCEEAKLLMGFIIAKGSQSPRLKPTERATVSRPNTINFTLNKIQSNLHKIKHWKIQHGTYHDLENKKATWFIDSPYQYGGHVYPENEIDFSHLSKWCKTRSGQVIVCENTKADWMDFKPMITMNGTIHKTTEAIWTNYPTSYAQEQLTIFSNEKTN